MALLGGPRLNLRQRSARDRFEYRLVRTSNGAWKWSKEDFVDVCAVLFSGNGRSRQRIHSSRTAVTTRSSRMSKTLERASSSLMNIFHTYSSKSVPLITPTSSEDLETAYSEHGAYSSSTRHSLVHLAAQDPEFWIRANIQQERAEFHRTDDEIPNDSLNKIEERDIFEHLIYEEVYHLTFKKKCKWLFREISDWLTRNSDDPVTLLTVNRDNIVEDSLVLLQIPPSTWRHRLKVRFQNEIGVDTGGLLREWFTTLSMELFSAEIGLFVYTASEDAGYWINPVKKSPEDLQHYKFAGRLLGKGLLENQVFTGRLASPLFKHLLGYPVDLEDIESIDAELYGGLTWLRDNTGADSLGLDFTTQELSATGEIQAVDLQPNGAHIPLTDSNKSEYLRLMLAHKLFKSVEPQLSALLCGFREIIPEQLLMPFNYKELELLLCGVSEIDVRDWRDHTEVEFLDSHLNGRAEFNLITWFWEVVETFTEDEKSKLLQFATGSSRVPLEGFKGLTSHDGRLKPFTLHIIECRGTDATKIPRARTCFNRLDLPLYKSKEDTEKFLRLVLDMGNSPFTMA